jgi:hypothetical protein
LDFGKQLYLLLLCRPDLTVTNDCSYIVL